MSLTTPSSQPNDNPYILTLPLNSALVEGLISVIIDLLFLTLLASSVRVLRTNHKRRVVYEAGDLLRLRSSSAAASPSAPAWRRLLDAFLPAVHLGAPCLLNFLLLLQIFATIAAVLLGFSVNGRTDHALAPTVLQRVVLLRAPRDPVSFRYAAEYSVLPNQTLQTQLPHYLSKRIVLLSLIGRCQRCFFTTCAHLAYYPANPGGPDDLELVPEKAARERLRPQCITDTDFERTLVNWRYPVDRNLPSVSCRVARIDVTFSGNDTPTRATAVAERAACNVAILETRCYRRSGVRDVCASAARYKESSLLRLLVLRATDSGGWQVESTVFSMSEEAPALSDAQVRRYLDGVSFLASLNAGAAWRLDLMLFLHLVPDARLRRRDRAAEINVSDFDLRLAAPSFAVVALAVGIVLAFGAVTLFQLRARRARQEEVCNTFGSVSDVLQLLAPAPTSYARSGTLEVDSAPVVGVLRDAPRIGVAVGGSDLIGGSDCPEEEIL